MFLCNQTESKPDNVVNLSSYQLSDNETNTLSRGLSFVPYNPYTNHVTDTDITEFTRNMRLRFKYRDVPTSNNPFRLKSKQTPGPSNYTPLENLINRIKSTLSQIKPTIGTPNLPEDGMNLIKKLGNENSLREISDAH